MEVEDKAEKLIIQLTLEKYANEVKWLAKDAQENLESGTEDLFPLYLETTYKKTIVGLFQKRYKHFYDEHDYYWGQDIGFCVLDNEDRILWEYDQRSAALVNLFDAAREQASGIDNILDGLLNE